MTSTPNTLRPNVMTMPTPLLLGIVALACALIFGKYILPSAPGTDTPAPATPVEASSALGSLASTHVDPPTVSEPPSVDNVLSGLLSGNKHPEAVPTLVVDNFTAALRDDSIKAGFDPPPVQGVWSNVDMTTDTYKAKAAIINQQLKSIDAKPISITPNNNGGEAWIFTPIIGWHKCWAIIDIDHYQGVQMDAEFWFATPRTFREAMLKECQAMVK